MHLEVPGFLSTEIACDHSGATGNTSGFELITHAGLTDGPAIQHDPEQTPSACNRTGELRKFVTPLPIEGERHFPAAAVLLLLAPCSNEVLAGEGRRLEPIHNFFIGTS